MLLPVVFAPHFNCKEASLPSWTHICVGLRSAVSAHTQRALALPHSFFPMDCLCRGLRSLHMRNILHAVAREEVHFALYWAVLEHMTFPQVRDFPPGV